MNTRTPILRALSVALAGLVGAVHAGSAFSTGETSVPALAQNTHFHGIAVDQNDPRRVLLATHHGLYAVAPDGTARRISNTSDDFMGFTPHPSDPAVLYASGHPAGGGNLGFIVSTDGGTSWSKLADGVGGPVDFHQMDVSKADPKVIYGVFGGLQKSTDGGRSWHRVGAAPEGLIDLATSSTDAQLVYAATQGGLLKSTDGGRRWGPAHDSNRPATMVQATPSGQIYAFIVGVGLVRASETELRWQTVNNGFGGSVILHFAAGPTNSRTHYAVTFDTKIRAQGLQVSHDDGETWLQLSGK